jgi:dephospho-CoA kinase
MISSAAMMLVGLTGGVATGKSTVSKMFRQCGAVVIDADALAREIVQPGKPAWREIVRAFGKDMLNPDRTINRHSLGTMVFHDKKKLRRLERIIHPRVAREQTKLAKQAGKNDPHAIVIYDVPLLFEAHIDKRVDKVIVVTADQKTQLDRLRKRNGLSRTEALCRIRSQLPLAQKRRLADYVLDGTHTRRQLAREVSHLLEDLRTLH